MRKCPVCSSLMDQSVDDYPSGAWECSVCGCIERNDEAEDFDPGDELTEEEGIKAIVKLQAVGGIEESEERARIGWSRMGEADRAQTMAMYRLVMGFEDMEKS